MKMSSLLAGLILYVGFVEYSVLRAVLTRMVSQLNWFKSEVITTDLGLEPLQSSRNSLSSMKNTATSPSSFLTKSQEKMPKVLQKVREEGVSLESR